MISSRLPFIVLLGRLGGAVTGIFLEANAAYQLAQGNLKLMFGTWIMQSGSGAVGFASSATTATLFAGYQANCKRFDVHGEPPPSYLETEQENGFNYFQFTLNILPLPTERMHLGCSISIWGAPFGFSAHTYTHIHTHTDNFFVFFKLFLTAQPSPGGVI